MGERVANAEPSPPGAHASGGGAGETEDQAWQRYSRQMLLPAIGADGQRALRAGRVAVVGLGATGSALAGLLARAGVGHLTLIDRDFVEASNLQRQLLFTEADAGAVRTKAEAARDHLLAANSDVCVSVHVADLTPANAADLLSGHDLLLDGTDNFETRFLLNDFAVARRMPWIYTAALGTYAATMNVLPAGVAGAPTACLACLFPAPPIGTGVTCDTGGILAPAVTVAASIAATEALKLLSGNAAAMRRTLWSLDLWSGERSEVNAAAPDLECTVCGAREFRYLAGQRQPQVTLCGRNSVQIHEHGRALDLVLLAERLRAHGEVRHTASLLRFKVPAPESGGAHTLTVFPDGRTLVQGTTHVPTARGLYARFIGA